MSSGLLVTCTGESSHFLFRWDLTRLTLDMLQRHVLWEHQRPSSNYLVHTRHQGMVELGFMHGPLGTPKPYKRRYNLCVFCVLSVNQMAQAMVMKNCVCLLLLLMVVVAAEGASKKAKAKCENKRTNRNHALCDGTEHYCPASCPDKCHVNCDTCSPVCSKFFCIRQYFKSSILLSRQNEGQNEGLVLTWLRVVIEAKI